MRLTNKAFPLSGGHPSGWNCNEELRLELSGKSALTTSRLMIFVALVLASTTALGELVQIHFLLGHASVQTIERYIGYSRQNFKEGNRLLQAVLSFGANRVSGFSNGDFMAGLYSESAKHVGSREGAAYSA